MKPQILSVGEIAEIICVDRRTVYAWIEQDMIPYVELPSTGLKSFRLYRLLTGSKPEYRIPLQGFLSCLPSLYPGDASDAFQAS